MRCVFSVFFLYPKRDRNLARLYTGETKVTSDQGANAAMLGDRQYQVIHNQEIEDFQSGEWR